MMWRFFEATSAAFTSAGVPVRPYGHFGGLEMMNPSFMWLFGLMWLVTWGLVIAALVALVRWLWKKGSK